MEERGNEASLKNTASHTKEKLNTINVSWDDDEDVVNSQVVREPLLSSVLCTRPNDEDDDIGHNFSAQKSKITVNCSCTRSTLLSISKKEKVKQ